MYGLRQLTKCAGHITCNNTRGNEIGMVEPLGSVPREAVSQVLFGMAVLIGGQLLVERVFVYSVPVSVFITVGGGVYFLYLLLTQRKA